MGQVIAFIPVRGGSKSIPLKNIKSFCGKPLVYWVVSALQQTKAVDKIVIATDSHEIEDVVSSFKFSKIVIFSRSHENASDTASTESVMLEYIQNSDLDENDIFILVQATSPLTETKHFTEALDQYLSGKYDSMLTCVRSYRFLWNSDGTSKNYDFRIRPRRQDFAGELMENGAFYINTIRNILKDGNRLSGKIGIYEMPDYTATEIDEPDDWIILENLKRKYTYQQENTDLCSIKLFLSDVDGVLTDGGMYYSENGSELKKFNTRDGVAFRLLKEAGVKTGIITSEETEMVKRRAEKLKVDYCYQGKYGKGKLTSVTDICIKEGISLSEVAYIGDDINCIDIIQAVGVKACPADAHTLIKKIPGIIILQKKGGEGVVREFVDNYKKMMR